MEQHQWKISKQVELSILYGSHRWQACSHSPAKDSGSSKIFQKSALKKVMDKQLIEFPGAKFLVGTDEKRESTLLEMTHSHLENIWWNHFQIGSLKSVSAIRLCTRKTKLKWMVSKEDTNVSLKNWKNYDRTFKGSHCRYKKR